MTEIRPFARRDREQLTRLVNAHVAAATPGASVPAATLLSQLEHPLGEYITGPWVSDVTTLIAIEGDRVVAAAHLRRYADDDRATQSYRNAGEIVWLVCWPDELAAGRAICAAAVTHLTRWSVRVCYGDGSIPAPGVYGVSDAWPHVQHLYETAGFDPSDGQIEVVFAGDLASIPKPGPSPVAGVTLRRELGPLGTAFHAVLDGQIVGTYEVDDDLSRGSANLAVAAWADECNHWVRDELRTRGIGTWLLQSGADWLRLGGKSRLMAYAIEGEDTARRTSYYGRFGMQPINRTVRGWSRTPES